MSLKPNEMKIMKELQAINMPICSKDLASMTGIHPQSIGRYIKSLKDLELVKTQIRQIHNKRFNMILLRKKGKETKYLEIKINAVKPRLLTPKEKKIMKKEVRPTIDKPIYSKSWILDEFELVKSFMRKGLRPTQTLAVKTFEKHLKELI